MADTSFSEAVERALALAMARDPRVVVIGEDVRMLRRNAFVRFGGERVVDSPISESALLGTALGASMAGLRPVVEVMFVDFIGVALDQLLNHAAKLEAFSGGRWQAPLVVRAACGGGYGDAGQHEQALWGLLAGIPGLSVVVPSTPADAAGLLLSALAAPGPVVFLEHKLLSEQWLDYVGGASRAGVEFDVPAAGVHGEVAREPAPVPLGVAALRRRGTDLVMVSLGVGVHRCVEAADRLAAEGLSAAVLDLRSVAPLDSEAVLDLAARTRRVLVVDEDYTRGGLSGEVAALLGEHGVQSAYARVTTEETIPYARDLEDAVLPNVDRIMAAAHFLLASRPGRGG
ncbi:transketolase C-terminal domain-containing protein [Knoellia sp. 3-2P3]|uniref:alpha-ketoacid dehydrogenase subunit beta n=1 Tax=unclassified Knoellia TaxID=2618719 RepID=UPI0023DA9F03|nr:transketolase C-terminal domain-containing protein [Knoellia sp. 3-2P3]MDF2091000.1 transketolase C-terminal domain-containing protein [Knoellia sp. 3-2P3]